MELSDEAKKYADSAIRLAIDFDYENGDIEAEEYERYEAEANEALGYLGCGPIDHSWRFKPPARSELEQLVEAIEVQDRLDAQKKGTKNVARQN
jgi:hypothetical protein